MRFSLAVPLERDTKRQIRSYEQIEQLALALEIYGWSTIWLHTYPEEYLNQAQSLLRALQLLCNVTDRIDLGAIVRLPSSEQEDSFFEDLKRIDDLSSGRIRIAIIAKEAESLSFARRASRVLELDGSAWQARRIQIVSDKPISQRTAHTAPFGKLFKQNDGQEAHRTILTYSSNSQDKWLSHFLPLKADSSLSSQLARQLFTIADPSSFDESICELHPFPSQNDSLLDLIRELNQSILPQLAQRPLVKSSFQDFVKFENILFS